MSKSNSWENNLLDLLFLNVDAALIGDATGLRGSSTAGSLYISLHTSDPGETGDQTSNETSYGSYARVAVARSGVGFTRTNNLIENAATITFPTCSSGSSTITHFGVGTASSGAGKLLYSGALTGSLIVNTSITPTFAAGALDITED